MSSGYLAAQTPASLDIAHRGERRTDNEHALEAHLDRPPDSLAVRIHGVPEDILDVEGVFLCVMPDHEAAVDPAQHEEHLLPRARASQSLGEYLRGQRIGDGVVDPPRSCPPETEAVQPYAVQTKTAQDQDIAISQAQHMRAACQPRDSAPVEDPRHDRAQKPGHQATGAPSNHRGSQRREPPAPATDFARWNPGEA